MPNHFMKWRIFSLGCIKIRKGTDISYKVLDFARFCWYILYKNLTYSMKGARHMKNIMIMDMRMMGMLMCNAMN